MSFVALFDFSFGTLSGFQLNSRFCWTFTEYNSLHLRFNILLLHYCRLFFWGGSILVEKSFPQSAVTGGKWTGVLEQLRNSSLHLRAALIRDRSGFLKLSQHHGNQPYTGPNHSNKPVWRPETRDKRFAQEDHCIWEQKELSAELYSECPVLHRPEGPSRMYHGGGQWWEILQPSSNRGHCTDVCCQWGKTGSIEDYKHNMAMKPEKIKLFWWSWGCSVGSPHILISHSHTIPV